ncbi:hypothetical protein RN001_008012 [Aquatica leii]|uniref:Uncharacterized protein n=1 Tax=Aquatica leii TaxID=1421715 RepID=A0AAN7PCS4_9COLE|nr:hypothetical protein RN001_008012 [Aquatica leii]
MLKYVPMPSISESPTVENKNDESVIIKDNDDTVNNESEAKGALDDLKSDFSQNEDDAPDFQSVHKSSSEEELSSNEDVSVTAQSKPHNSSSDDDEEPPITKRKKSPKSYYGKNKFKWSADAPNQNVCTRCHNIITHVPGIIDPAKRIM